MPEFKYNITNAKLTRLKAATCGFHRIPQIPDPEDPDNIIDEFTPAEWTREYWRREMADKVHKWEQFLAKKAIQLDEILT